MLTSSLAPYRGRNGKEVCFDYKRPNRVFWSSHVDIQTKEYILLICVYATSYIIIQICTEQCSVFVKC